MNIQITPSLILLALLLPGAARAESMQQKIRAVVVRHIDEIKTCAGTPGPTKFASRGTVVVDFEIDEAGVISKLSVDQKKTDLKNQKLYECLAGRLKSWKFPASPKNQITSISYPFFFTSFFDDASISVRADKVKLICTNKDFDAIDDTVWYVPVGAAPAYFLKSENGPASKKYVVAGDLLIAGKESPQGIFACYIKARKIVAKGWLKKADLVNFKRVDFGAFDAATPPGQVNAAIGELSKMAGRLPQVKDWKGGWVDLDGNGVKIWEEKNAWRLLTDIEGEIGSGDESEDSLKLEVSGSFAHHQSDPPKNGPCDVVIVAFNNALLVTSGSHCLGSGADHSYPQFNGLYWKK